MKKIKIKSQEDEMEKVRAAWITVFVLAQSSEHYREKVEGKDLKIIGGIVMDYLDRIATDKRRIEDKL